MLHLLHVATDTLDVEIVEQPLAFGVPWPNCVCTETNWGISTSFWCDFRVPAGSDGFEWPWKAGRKIHFRWIAIYYTPIYTGRRGANFFRTSYNAYTEHQFLHSDVFLCLAQ